MHFQSTSNSDIPIHYMKGLWQMRPFLYICILLRNQNMIQSLQVNIMVSYKNYVTNYNIYT